MKTILRTALLLALACSVGHARAQVLHAAIQTATATPSVALTWTPATSCTSPVTCTFKVYRCVGTCTIGSGTWTPLTVTGNDVGSCTDPDVANIGVASYYVVDLATGNGWNATPGAGSNVAVATFPVQAPTGLAATAN